MAEEYDYPELTEEQIKALEDPYFTSIECCGLVDDGFDEKNCADIYRFKNNCSDTNDPEGSIWTLSLFPPIEAVRGYKQFSLFNDKGGESYDGIFVMCLDNELELKHRRKKTYKKNSVHYSTWIGYLMDGAAVVMYRAMPLNENGTLNEPEKRTDIRIYIWNKKANPL